MKKYIKPTVEVIEMETAAVVATSLTLSETTTESVYEGRRRGDDWTDYEGE